MVTASDKNIEQKNLNKKKHKKETKKAVSQINKILPYVKNPIAKRNTFLAVPNCCYPNEGASRYYTLPKGDLGATTVKELAPLHSRKDPVAGCSYSLTAQDHAICR